MESLRIRLLGGLELERDGRPLPAPSPQKAALLLAYLLTARDRPHPRSLLAGLFWGEQAEARARHNLSDALWRLRSLIEAGPGAPSLLLFEGDAVRFNPDSGAEIDVRRFEMLLAAPAGAAALAEAVDLYRGDLLAGYYDDWVLLERERLRRLYLDGLRRLVAAHSAAHDWEAAAGAAARLVQADPYEESATRELMRLYYRLGRRDRALQQFAALEAVLATDLHLEPEPETLALRDHILAGTMSREPGEAGTSRPALGALALPPGPGGRPALLGRDQEQARLAAWLSGPIAAPPMLVVLGEAGVGKTRLVQDAAETAQRRRMIVLWGHYPPLAAPLPYGGLVEALRAGLQVAGSPALEPLWLSEVSRLLPELAAFHPGLPAPIDLPADQERTRLWEALTRYLLALGHDGRVVFVLEDVQWVDPATLDLLQYALPRLVGVDQGIRLLVTLRSEDLADTPGLPDALRALEARGLVEGLPLGRLTPAVVEELARATLGVAGAAPALGRRLWQETEGNPFFALETLRFWTEQGLLRRDAAGTWQVPAGDLAALPTPASIRRVLEQRLARLSPAARSVIELGAVLGGEVPERLLSEASGSTPEAVLSPAEELLRRELWRELPDGSGYQFAHQKVREVAYAGISGPRRRHLHRLAAAALESEPPAAVEKLAEHWLAGGDPLRALPYLRRAAERAAATYANEEALTFYDRALAAVETLPPPAQEFDTVYGLRAGRATLLKRLERMTAATADLDALVALAQAAGRPGRLADALARRGAHWISQACYDEALADLQAALPLARAAGDTPAIARILTQELRIHIRRGDHPAALAAAGAALAAYRAAADLRGEVEILSLLGPAHGERGEIAQAVTLLQEAREKVARLPEALHLEARIVNNLGLVLSAPGAACDLFARALAIGEQTGSLPLQQTGHQNLAELLCRYGDYAGAAAHLARATDLAAQAGSRHDLATLLVTRGQLRAVAGDPAARADFREAVTALDALGARLGLAGALLALGDYLLDGGAFAPGLEAVERSLVLWRELGRPYGAGQAALYAAQQARAYLGLRRAGAARRAVQEARAHLAAAHAAGPLPWTDPSVEVYAHCRAVLLGLRDAAAAAAVLESGYGCMWNLAAACGEPLGAAYLANVRECRALRAAGPGDAAPTGSAPADAAPSGDPAAGAERKVAARRAQIVVMLRDAAAGGRPLDDAALARNFGVSPRTIERDLAALRRARRLT